MPTTSPRRPRLDAASAAAVARACLPYLGAASLASLIAFVLLRLWQVDLRVPIDWGGDAVSHAMMVKTVMDHGWYLSNPDLGVPGHLLMYDYPITESAQLLIVKAAALFSSSWPLVFNLYFLLGFPLITLSALAVMRHLKVAWGPAIVTSILYAFLPSRMLKGEGHLFLDVFFQVPPILLVTLWVTGDAPPLFGDGSAPGSGARRRRAVAAVLICAATACFGAYYAFFAAAVMAAGGAWAAVVRRSPRNLLAGLALAGVVIATLAANGIPNLVYKARHGANVEVAKRVPGESEVFGLKITQLLLPTDGHRVPALRRLKERYNANAPLVTENSVTSLGFAGAAGFLALLGVALLGARRERPRDDLWRPVSVLNLMCVLFGTIGGFGTLFALLVSPQIRGYCRINVLIAFWSLLATALLLERLARRWPRAGAVVMVSVLGLGLRDQVPVWAVRDHAYTRRLYGGEETFVERIAARVPARAMIFQLPFYGFPELPPLEGINGYDPLRLYLHGHGLRWSYPTMRGRPDEIWPREVAGSPPAAMVTSLRAAGFAGVAIDRFGYADHGAAVERGLSGVLGAAPEASPDGRHAFFALAAPAAK